MVTGEKPFEFRKPTKWILSRVYDKNGVERKYDVVKITNGYGKHRPQFVAKFEGVQRGWKETFKYSNGLTVDVDFETIIISLGKIGITRNIKKDEQLF